MFSEQTMSTITKTNVLTATKRRKVHLDSKCIHFNRENNFARKRNKCLWNTIRVKQLHETRVRQTHGLSYIFSTFLRSIKEKGIVLIYVHFHSKFKTKPTSYYFGTNSFKWIFIISKCIFYDTNWLSCSQSRAWL